MNDVRISVIVPSRDNITFLSNALESLYETLQDDDEIIVVGNGTPDEIAVTEGYVNALTASRKIPTRFVPCHVSGYTPATNMGLQESRGDFIVITNDDIIAAPGWADQLISALLDAQRDAPETLWGYAGPHSNFGMPVQNLEQKTFPEAHDPSRRADMAKRLLQAKQSWAPIATMSGFCLMMTRAAFHQVGLLDQNFPGGGFTDNDWQLRAQEAGFMGLVAAKSFVYHVGHVSMDKYTPGHKGGVENITQFLAKWYRPRPQSLCVCYRVKIDTEHDLNLLEASVRSAARVADSIVILDDRSMMDIMFELKLRCPDEVKKVQAYVRKENTEDFNEVRDRNTLLRLAREQAPDWILNLDHDEVLNDELTAEQMQQLLNPVDPQTKAYAFPIYTFWRGNDTVRMDGVWGTMNVGTLFKNAACFGDIHQMGGDSTFHCRRIPTYIPADCVKTTYALVVKHYGYTTVEHATQKQQWYQQNDTEKNLVSIGTQNYEHLTDESKLQLYPYSKKTLTIAMLTRNEPMLLAKQIRTWQNYAEKLLVIDTGCTDSSAADARALGVEVLTYRCCAQALEPDHLLCDFAQARNFALCRITTDYVLFLDPDEDGDSNFAHMLPRYLLQDRDVYIIKRRDYQQTPKGLVPQIVPTPKLFRVDPRLRYSRSIHESLEPALKRYGAELSICETDLLLNNWSFVHNKGPARQAKMMQYAVRLTEILEQDPTDAVAWYTLGMHMLADRMFDDADECFAKAILHEPMFFEARYMYASRMVQRGVEILINSPPKSVRRGDLVSEATQLIKANLPFCRDIRWPRDGRWAEPK